MSESPMKIKKKQSLSILSGSDINQLHNNSIHSNSKETLSKPIRERVISESTGLVKFSLRSGNTQREGKHNDTTEKEVTWDGNDENHHGLPIYLPVNKSDDRRAEQDKKIDVVVSPYETDENREEDDRSKVLLFKIASEQRQLLELKEQVKFHELELKRLESEYKDMVLNSSGSNMISSSTTTTTTTGSQLSQATNTAIKQISKKASALTLKKPLSISKNDLSATSSRGSQTTSRSSSSSSNNNLQFNAQITVENLKNDITKTFNDLNIKQDLTNTINEIKNNFNQSNNDIQASQLLKKFLGPSNKLKEDFSSKFNTFFKLPQNQNNTQQHDFQHEEFMDKEELRAMLNESFNYSDCHFLEEDSKSRNNSPMKARRMNSRILEDLEEEDNEEENDSYLAGDSSFEQDYGSEPTELKF